MDQEGDPVHPGGGQEEQRSPDLVWDTAWCYYHKLGFADESIILRRLFRDDEDIAFKTYYDPERRQDVVGDDNFKLGYGWFSQAVALVDAGVSSRLGTGGTAGRDRVRRRHARSGRDVPRTSPSARCRRTARPATPPASRR